MISETLWDVQKPNHAFWDAFEEILARLNDMGIIVDLILLPKPAALVLGYPVISMRKELTRQGTHDTLLGAEATLAQEALTSVDEHVTAAYPPTYSWCGEADQTVSPENTKRMAKALKNVGVPFQCEVFPGVDHGVGPGTGSAAEGWIERAVSFWLAQGGSENQP